MECIHDAHDGAEETDKRRNGPDGSQPGQALFHEGESFARCGLGRAFKRGDIARRPVSSGLAAVCLVDLVKYVDQRTGLVLLGDGADLLQTRRFAKGTKEGPALAAGAAKPDPLAKDDGPGEETGKGEKSEDGQRDRPAGTEHLENCVAAGMGRRHGCALVVALKEQEDREKNRLGCHLWLFERVAGRNRCG